MEPYEQTILTANENGNTSVILYFKTLVETAAAKHRLRNCGYVVSSHADKDMVWLQVSWGPQIIPDIDGVQPMTAPTGKILSIKPKYTK